MDSSSSHRTYPNFDPQISREDEEKQSWLQLGLGLSYATTNSNCTTLSNSYLSLDQNDKVGNLGLGLGLGLEIKQGIEFDCQNSTVKEIIVPSSNFHCNDENDNVCAVPSLSLPFHMVDDNRLLSKFAIRNDSHDYLSSRSRPKSAGLWFTLHSTTNWEGKGLPQIPKAYIRVKDENVTVFMVQKYLVTKLGLSNETEIDISCMGQKLLQTQTLKQVRDAVWLPRLVDSVSSTTKSYQDYSFDYLMSLHYGRHTVFD